MIEQGQQAPDFELPDETGTPRRLSTLLADGPVVLFFYPAAMTGGCTAEACHFRDLAGEFAEVGAQRVGISGDDVARQQEFSAKHAFDYPLLADTDGDVARAYGVARRVGPPRRATFVVGRDGLVLDVVRSEVRMTVHADRALAALR